MTTPFNTFVAGVPAAGTITGTELVPVVKAGVSSQTTPALLVAYTVSLANVFTATQTEQQSIAANTSGDGLVLINPTAAAAASQRFSPRLRLTGQGWGTTAPASASVDWIIENQPIQGTTNPSSSLVFSFSVGGGAFSAIATFSSVGSLACTGAITGSTLQPTSSSALTAAGVSRPATNTLGFATNSALRATIDPSGNFIHLFGVADQSKSVQIPTTGFTITVANATQSLILNPAGTLAAGTITMPATPIDGQEVRFSSTQTVTALTVSPNAAQTISNAPTTIAPGQGYGYIYHLATTNWFRLY